MNYQRCQVRALLFASSPHPYIKDNLLKLKINIAFFLLTIMYTLLNMHRGNIRTFLSLYKNVPNFSFHLWYDKSLRYEQCGTVKENCDIPLTFFYLFFGELDISE